jgi:hypothetical protein
MESVIINAISFDNEWEYRRLLELLVETCPNMMSNIISKGLLSKNEEVVEAAEDFQKN